MTIEAVEEAPARSGGRVPGVSCETLLACLFRLGVQSGVYAEVQAVRRRNLLEGETLPAGRLIELAHEFGKNVGSRVVIQQKIGQSDLAAMAGIARESVSRILNDWKRRKLVSRPSDYYWIDNKVQLQKEAEL